jgi:hypothetical protein
MDKKENVYFGYFTKSEQQRMLFEDILRLREIFGAPHRIAYLRSLVRTRRYTRTVYPPGWKKE